MGLKSYLDRAAEGEVPPSPTTPPLLSHRYSQQERKVPADKLVAELLGQGRHDLSFEVRTLFGELFGLLLERGVLTPSDLERMLPSWKLEVSE